MNNEEHDANSLPKSKDWPNDFERTLEKLLLKMLASLGRLSVIKERLLLL